MGEAHRELARERQSRREQEEDRRQERDLWEREQLWNSSQVQELSREVMRGNSCGTPAKYRSYLER